MCSPLEKGRGSNCQPGNHSLDKGARERRNECVAFKEGERKGSQEFHHQAMKPNGKRRRESSIFKFGSFLSISLPLHHLAHCGLLLVGIPQYQSPFENERERMNDAMLFQDTSIETHTHVQKRARGFECLWMLIQKFGRRAALIPPVGWRHEGSPSHLRSHKWNTTSVVPPFPLSTASIRF